MYVQDYDEDIPPYAIRHLDPAGWGARWYTLIEPYMKNDQLLVCPSDRGHWISYGYNGYYLINPQWSSNSHAADYLAEIERPAEMIVLGEARENGIFLYRPDQITNPDLAEHMTFDRHNGGCNYAFADGHSKWLAKGEFPPDNSTLAKYYYAR